MRDTLFGGEITALGRGTGSGGLVEVSGKEGLVIDGTVSTAIGAALAYEAAHGGRTVALLGDLTFVHDSSGLLIGQSFNPRPSCDGRSDVVEAVADDLRFQSAPVV